MSEAQLFEILTEMRLSGAREELEHQLANTGYADMPFVDRMLRMFQAEADRRQRNRIERLTQAAQFKYVNANPEAIDYSKDRKLDKAHILDLVKCEWISRGQNMVITGASGTGKTWLASALGNSAVRHEKSTRYVRTSRLAEELNFARLDGSLTKLRTRGPKKAACLVVRKWRSRQTCRANRASSNRSGRPLAVADSSYASSATRSLSGLATNPPKSM